MPQLKELEQFFQEFSSEEGLKNNN